MKKNKLVKINAYMKIFNKNPTKFIPTTEIKKILTFTKNKFII